MTDCLVTTDWLQRHLDDPAIRIVDMRGTVDAATSPDGEQTARYLGRPDLFAAGHIPGAVYLDWTADIVDEQDPIPAQVAPPEKLARVFGTAGIGDETLVVAYDDHPAMQFATRLWWVLRYAGHDAVAVLDGGWRKWSEEGRPVTTATAVPPAGRFTPRIQHAWRSTAEQIAAGLGDAGVVLVDARDDGQYTGRIRRGVRGGHIPGALHLPREALIAPDGTFLPVAAIREAILRAGISLDDPGRPVVAYCNGGVAATSVLFALSRLGHRALSNYDGSWNEWNERLELPVEP